MPRLFSGHSRTLSGQQSIETGDTPDLRPGSETFSTFSDVQAPPVEHAGPRPRNHPKAQLKLPSPSEDTQREMIPVLSLLTAHSARVYEEGYFMLLNDINHDGKPVANRQWVEVFAMLTGPTLACWDAQALDQGIDCKPTYMNITDANFKSVASLPTGKTALERIIVMSTTMKNRYLLQFASDKSFNQWTAALRLSSFERTALQEAYTGALLSSRGSKLNGAKALLGGTKIVREDWCQVRFGGGLPWSRCWYVLTPPNLIKNKKQRKAGMGEIAFYESPKHVKKDPLAVITTAYSAYAVFPERAVLVDMSNLIKCHGLVRFNKETETRESQIFLMPEQHPGIKGSETLIRFIIPFLDIFQLYGRPKRLNADKRDIRSLLFAMPTLPKAYYLDVVDVGMLTALPESQGWSPQDWMQKIKEMLARKLASGYQGLGNIHELAARDSTTEASTTSGSTKSDKGVIVAKREAPKPPGAAGAGSASTLGASTLGGSFGTSGTTLGTTNGASSTLLAPPELDRTRAISQPRAMDSFVPPRSPMVASHERSLSEGEDRNDLMSAPYTPPANEQQNVFRFSPRRGEREPQTSQSAQPSGVRSLDPSAQGATQGHPQGHRQGVPPTAIGMPGAIETKPGHYSYAEYSEYMRTYLANEIESPQKNKPSGPRPMGQGQSGAAGAQGAPQGGPAPSAFAQGGPRPGQSPYGQPQPQRVASGPGVPQGMPQGAPPSASQTSLRGAPRKVSGGYPGQGPQYGGPQGASGAPQGAPQGGVGAGGQGPQNAQPRRYPQGGQGGPGYQQPHPAGPGPSSAQGNPYAQAQPQPRQQGPYAAVQPMAPSGGHPPTNPYRPSAPHGAPNGVPNGTTRPVHTDVRTAPPMTRTTQPLQQLQQPQTARRTDPYAIAQQASQPPRGRVQGARPMP